MVVKKKKVVCPVCNEEHDLVELPEREGVLGATCNASGGPRLVFEQPKDFVASKSESKPPADKSSGDEPPKEDDK